MNTFSAFRTPNMILENYIYDQKKKFILTYYLIGIHFILTHSIFAFYTDNLTTSILVPSFNHRKNQIFNIILDKIQKYVSIKILFEFDIFSIEILMSLTLSFQVYHENILSEPQKCYQLTGSALLPAAESDVKFYKILYTVYSLYS